MVEKESLGNSQASVEARMKTEKKKMINKVMRGR